MHCFALEVDEGIIFRGFLSGLTIENRWRKIHLVVGEGESKDGMEVMNTYVVL